jgi:hypothetical protein
MYKDSKGIDVVVCMQKLTIPAGVEFVPMIRGASDVMSSNLATAKASGTTLLGFNEPDVPGQVMTPPARSNHVPQMQDAICLPACFRHCFWPSKGP